MKQFGLFGKGTGKLGSSVHAISFGQQIVRQYNPVVTNPNTSLQVDQRSKFKLMSQVAASVSPVIAIPRVGLSSPRNLFVKKNFPLVTLQGQNASIDYTKLQLTDGSAFMPTATVNAHDNQQVAVQVDLGAIPSASRIVISFFDAQDDNQLRFIKSEVLDVVSGSSSVTTGMGGNFPKLAVAAYAMFDNGENASAKYGNYAIQDGSTLAQLLSSRVLRADGQTLSATSWLVTTATTA